MEPSQLARILDGEGVVEDSIAQLDIPPQANIQLVPDEWKPLSFYKQQVPHFSRAKQLFDEMMIKVVEAYHPISAPIAMTYGEEFYVHKVRALQRKLQKRKYRRVLQAHPVFKQMTQYLDTHPRKIYDDMMAHRGK